MSGNISHKDISIQDADQALKYAYNNVDKTFSVNGFLVGKVGHKIVVTAGATTDQFDFYDDANLLYTLVITYADNTKAQMTQAERTA